MQRTYTIKLVVRGTFSRKLKAKSLAAGMLKRLRLPEEWSPAGTEVSCRAVRELKRPEPKENPEDAARANVLTRCCAILEEARAITQLPRQVSFRWHRHTDGGCGSIGQRHTAHAHRGGGGSTRRPSGNRVRLPKNLVCLNNRFLKMLTNYSENELTGLVLHEVSHFIVKKQGHGSRFQGVEGRVVDAWNRHKNTNLGSSYLTALMAEVEMRQQQEA